MLGLSFLEFPKFRSLQLDIIQRESRTASALLPIALFIIVLANLLVWFREHGLFSVPPVVVVMLPASTWPSQAATAATAAAAPTPDNGE